LIKGAFEEGEHLRFKKVIRHPDNPASLEIHLDQGRKREIRRLFEIFGFHVKTLRRFQIGELVLRKMPLGDCRPLARKEIDMIFEN
ncbi:MAG: rRNA pseudouridine synthase, partial [Verrucomicrobiota bacterium]